jgi:hypothetical protein
MTNIYIGQFVTLADFTREVNGTLFWNEVAQPYLDGSFYFDDEGGCHPTEHATPNMQYLVDAVMLEGFRFYRLEHKGAEMYLWGTFIAEHPSAGVTAYAQLEETLALLRSTSPMLGLDPNKVRLVLES